MKPSIGRIVHFHMVDGEARPAIVVQNWSRDSEESALNLQVFTDGSNDDGRLNEDERSGRDGGKPARSVVWRTSVPYDATGKPGTWRWPPHVYGG